MKIQKILLFFIFLLSSFQICSAQTNSADVTVLESLTEPSCEYLLSRLENLLAETYKTSSSLAYITIQGSNPIQNKFHEIGVKNLLRFRGFDEKRITIIAVNTKGNLKIDLAISPDGNIINNKPASEFSYKLPFSDSPIKFANQTVEVAKIDDRLTFVSECAACCIESAHLYLLSKFLESNPHLNASIKIFSKTRKRAKQLEKLLLDEATNEYKMPSKRLKITYGGVDKGISQLTGNISSIEINLTAVD